MSVLALVVISYERLTCDAGKKLLRKVLYLTARKGHKLVALQKIENTLPKQICDNAYVVSKVETLA